MVDRCRSCQAPIRWAVTGANRKSIPLDLEPTGDGNVELLDGYAKTWGTSHDWPAGVACDNLRQAAYATNGPTLFDNTEDIPA